MKRSINNLYNLATSDEEKEVVEEISFRRKWGRILTGGAVLGSAIGVGSLFGIERWRDNTESVLSKGLINDLGQFVAIAMSLGVAALITFAGVDVIDSYNMTNKYLEEHKEAVMTLKRRK